MMTALDMVLVVDLRARALTSMREAATELDFGGCVDDAISKLYDAASCLEASEVMLKGAK